MISLPVINHGTKASMHFWRLQVNHKVYGNKLWMNYFSIMLRADLCIGNSKYSLISFQLLYLWLGIVYVSALAEHTIFSDASFWSKDFSSWLLQRERAGQWLTAVKFLPGTKPQPNKLKPTALFPIYSKTYIHECVKAVITVRAISIPPNADPFPSLPPF